MSSTRQKQVSYKRPTNALVLGAGGVKGVAHIGVLEALEEAQIPIDIIVGCSIGSLIGALYADGYSPAKLLAHAKELMPRRPSYQAFGLPYLMQGLGGKGFFSTAQLRERLAELLTAHRFSELKTPLQVVATDVNQATLQTFKEGVLLDALCASAAIPAFFQAVEIGGKSYVDGAILTELPVYTAQKVGAQNVIASNVKGWHAIEMKGEVDNMGIRSYEIIRHYFDQEEEAQADITIRPDLSGVKHYLFADSDTMHEIYLRGKRAAQAAIPAIKARMQER